MTKRNTEQESDGKAPSAVKKEIVDSKDVPTSAIETPSRKLTHDDYTVGWICPLEVEQTAALEMLDEEHEQLPQAPTDHNVYNLGSIAGHNVAIAGLHQPGNNPAATVVTQMRMTFPNLRYGMLVGIGGGVPVKTDNGMVRLGDVVVSKPMGEHSGAVQYDHGKAKPRQFERRGALAPPPAVLLNAAQDLAAKRARSRKDPLETNIKRIDTGIRGLRKYKHPGTARDHLYQADYIHLMPELSCDDCPCDPSKRVQRPTDDDDDDEPYIVVHRGTIASGELTVNHAGLRDDIAKANGILCFEMGAAGALADFPCIVVRGISDYCDSHKNDQWQGYAAAVAAAYARQLFFHMPVDEVKRCISEAAENDIHLVKLRQDDQDRQKILDWLSPADFPTLQHDIISRKQEGTAQWFLDSDAFKRWLRGPDKTLFCYGMPGAGKTMMAAVAIDHLRRTARSNTGIAFLFCSYEAQIDQTAPNMFAALLKQLAQSRSDIAAPVMSMYGNHSNRGSKPSLDELTDALLSTCTVYPIVYIVIDALDECPNTNGERRRLIDKLHDLQTTSNVRLLFTSRSIPEVTQDFMSIPQLEVRASDEDVRRYIKGQMPRLPNCIQRDAELKSAVQTKIPNAIDGMFLLARLHIDTLLDKRTKRKVLSTLDRLKKGSAALNDAYSGTIQRIDGQPLGDRTLARSAICWISYAHRQLTTDELCCALAIGLGDKSLDTDNILDVDDIISVCAGLVTVEKESSIIRLVHYTTQEFFERVRQDWNSGAQEEIAAACLTYLSFDTFKSGSCATEEAFELRIAENGFFDYSARYWSEHVRPVERCSSTFTLALAFLCDDAFVNATIQATSFRSECEDYNAKFPRRTTGLHLAARYGLLYMVQRLLIEEHGGSTILIDLNDTCGRTPLSYAAEYGHGPVFKLLVEAAANIESKNNCSRTPLSYPAKHGQTAVVKFLIEAGANIESKDHFGQTPLSDAAEHGHAAGFKLLVEAGANIESKNGNGRTPLSYAAEYGQAAIVKLLIQAKADINSTDTSGLTPLSWAAIWGSEAVAKLLVDAKSDIESEDRVGQTPLSLSAESGYEAVVKQLLEPGANIESKSINGRTPLSWAAPGFRRGQDTVAKLPTESCLLGTRSEE